MSEHLDHPARPVELTEAASSSGTQPSHAKKPLRVIVADDDFHTREVLEYTLKTWGFDVCPAANGIDAWKMLEGEDVPTIAILDWMMPGMEGTELCRRVRLLERKHYVYILLHTCKTDTGDVIEGLRSGADDYLFKPLDPEELQARLVVAGRIIECQETLIADQARLDLYITAQKSAEKKLQEQAELLNLAHDAILVCDLQGRTRFWSQGAQDTYGWSAAEVISRIPRELLHTQFPVPFAEIMAIVHQYGQWEGELTQAGQDGSKIVVASRWSLQRNESGDPVAILEVNRNTTLSKRAEARLKVREAITSVLAESTSLVEASRQIINVVCEFMGWEAGGLWTLDAPAQVLRCVHAHHGNPRMREFTEASRGMSFQQGEGLPGRAWACGLPACIENMTKDAGVPRDAIVQRCGLRGGFAFPVISGGDVLAVLEFFGPEFRVPDRETLELFASIGSQIGQFVRRKQSETELARSEERYRNLVENSPALICTHDLQGEILSINSAAAATLGYEVAQCIGKNIRELLPPGPEFAFDRYLEDIQHNQVASGDMPVMDSKGQKLVWSYVNRLIDDGMGKPAYVLGHAQDITERIKMQKALRASQEATLAMEKKLSRLDPLTGLANRRAFYERAEIERKRCIRHKRPLGLAYIDLDNFKQVNDQSGHEVGDQVLVCVAATMQNNLRTEDLVTRLGGDEFALLLPETDGAKASFVIHKLHGLLMSAMLEKGWPITFSIGLVTFEEPAESIDQMVHRADELMYTVKHGGKNRIAILPARNEDRALINQELRQPGLEGQTALPGEERSYRQAMTK